MATTTRKSLKKAEFLKYWAGITPGQPLTPMAVPYKHSGSTFAEDGIRITGSREYIEQVLSHLKPLLRFENGQTRLQTTFAESVDRETGLPTGSWTCYIQVHERGGQAQMVNAWLAAVGMAD